MEYNIHNSVSPIQGLKQTRERLCSD